jgi:hypothetical protein
MSHKISLLKLAPFWSVLVFPHIDTALPEHADRLVCSAAERGSPWGRFDVRIDGRHPLLPVIGRMMNMRSRLTGIATGDQAIFVRRALFEQVGGYPEIPLMEHIAFCTRLKQIAPPLCLRERVEISGRRWERQGVLRTVWLMWRLRTIWRCSPSAMATSRTIDTPVQVAVFAKAPIPRLAKTRLAPVIGTAKAVRLQRRLSLRALAAARAAAIGPVSLWCAPDTAHRFFRAVRKKYRTPCYC